MKILKSVLNSLINELRDSGEKRFGYLLSSGGEIVDDYYIFKYDDRRKDDVKKQFKKIGKYYEYNDNAGFLATINETFQFEKYCLTNNVKKVAVFHVHLRHPNVFTKADWDLHPSNDLKHLIVSLRNKNYPKYEVFTIDKTATILENMFSVTPLEVLNEEEYFQWEAPKFDDINMLNRLKRKHLAEYLSKLSSIERFKFWKEKNVEPPDELLDESKYNVNKIKKTVVTNSEYKKLFTEHIYDDEYPVVNISYYDAFIFATWVGGRLLTLEEWENNCDCAVPRDSFEHFSKEMIKYASYSENSNGRLIPVAQLSSNKYDLYDMQGNVWEWCSIDGSNAPTKGGSFRAFPEMCRKEVTVLEEKNAFYDDLGFRLIMD